MEAQAGLANPMLGSRLVSKSILAPVSSNCVPIQQQKVLLNSIATAAATTASATSNHQDDKTKHQQQQDDKHSILICEAASDSEIDQDNKQEANNSHSNNNVKQIKSISCQPTTTQDGKVQQQAEQSNNAAQEFKVKTRKLQLEIDEKNEIINVLKDELETIKEENDKFRRDKIQLLKDSNRVKFLQDENDFLQDKVGSVDKLELEIKRLKEKLAELDFLKLRIGELEEDRAKAQEESLEFETKLKKAQTKLKRVYELEVELNKWRSFSHELEAERNSIQIKLLESIEQETKLNSINKQVEDEVKRLRELIKSYEEQRDEEQASNSLIMSVADLEQLDQHRKLLSPSDQRQQLELSEENTSLKQKLNEQGDILNELTEKNKFICEELESNRRLISDLRQDLACEKSLAAKLANQLTSFTKQIKNLDKQYFPIHDATTVSPLTKESAASSKLDVTKSNDCDKGKQSSLLKSVTTTGQPLGHETGQQVGCKLSARTTTKLPSTVASSAVMANKSAGTPEQTCNKDNEDDENFDESRLLSATATNNNNNNNNSDCSNSNNGGCNIVTASTTPLKANDQSDELARRGLFSPAELAGSEEDELEAKRKHVRGNSIEHNSNNGNSNNNNNNKACTIQRQVQQHLTSASPSSNARSQSSSPSSSNAIAIGHDSGFQSINQDFNQNSPPNVEAPSAAKGQAAELKEQIAPAKPNRSTPIGNGKTHQAAKTVALDLSTSKTAAECRGRRCRQSPPPPQPATPTQFKDRLPSTGGGQEVGSPILGQITDGSQKHQHQQLLPLPPLPTATAAATLSAASASSAISGGREGGVAAVETAAKTKATSPSSASASVSALSSVSSSGSNFVRNSLPSRSVNFGHSKSSAYLDRIRASVIASTTTNTSNKHMVDSRLISGDSRKNHSVAASPMQSSRQVNALIDPISQERLMISMLHQQQHQNQSQHERGAARHHLHHLHRPYQFPLPPASLDGADGLNEQQIAHLANLHQQHYYHHLQHMHQLHQMHHHQHHMHLHHHRLHHTYQPAASSATGTGAGAGADASNAGGSPNHQRQTTTKTTAAGESQQQQVETRNRQRELVTQPIYSGGSQFYAQFDQVYANMTANNNINQLNEQTRLVNNNNNHHQQRATNHRHPHHNYHHHQQQQPQQQQLNHYTLPQIDEINGLPSAEQATSAVVSCNQCDSPTKHQQQQQQNSSPSSSSPTSSTSSNLSASSASSSSSLNSLSASSAPLNRSALRHTTTNLTRRQFSVERKLIGALPMTATLSRVGSCRSSRPTNNANMLDTATHQAASMVCNQRQPQADGHSQLMRTPVKSHQPPMRTSKILSISQQSAANNNGQSGSSPNRKTALTPTGSVGGTTAKTATRPGSSSKVDKQRKQQTSNSANNDKAAVANKSSVWFEYGCV